MKQTLLKGIVSVSVLSLTLACSDGVGLGFDDGTGSIALSTEVDASVVSGRKSRTEYTDVTPADLSLKLTPADGSAAMTWESVTDFPTDRKFAVGSYTLEAFYGDESAEGFESPAFYGQTQFVVREKETTHVSLTASVASALVSIDYTDGFKDYMTSWSAEVKSAAGSAIHFDDAETRPAYVKPGQVEVNVEFMKPNGKGAKMTAATFEAVAARHYRVTVDIADGAGAVSLVISFDDTLENAEPITIDISDEVLNAAAPEVTAVGFTPGTSFEFIPGQAFADGLKFHVIARGGLQQVKLTTQSASLLSSGWPAEVDLASADATIQAKLSQLGLITRGVARDAAKLAVVDLTNVMKNIVYLNDGDNTSTFTLEVKDKFGKVSDAIALVAQSKPLVMNIQSTELYVGESTLTFTFEFNVGDPSELVTFKYRNSRGTESDFVPESIESLGNNVYKIVGSVDQANANKDLIFTAIAKDLKTAEYTIQRNPQVVPSNKAANVFATHAYIPVTIGEQDSDAALVAQLLGQATVMVSTDGVNYVEKPTTADAANFVLHVAGLDPATNYSFMIKNGRKESTEPVVKTFTTEAAAQLVNGNLDADVTIDGSDSHWENVVFLGWGTNNAMTTSEGADFGYVRISGTKQTDDAVSGKAVTIRTQGWGSGNSALGHVGSTATLRKIDPGLLHLGSNRSVRPSGYSERAGSFETTDLDCGVAFASRPSSVSFYYKYTAKNSADHGHVLVQAIDESGNVISQAENTLTAVDSYTEMTLPLTYTFNSVKIAKIYVRFLSTNVPEALTKDSDWITPPPFSNLSRGEYAGSTLYVDEIVCNY